jgi:preprotein translocase subunit SecD
VAFHRTKYALTDAIVLGAVACACHAAHQSAPPAATSPPPTTQAVAPIVTIQPLPVRPVEKSQPTTSDKCPATNPNAPTPPTNVLVTCDLTKTTLYTLGPEALRLALTHVEAPKSLTSDFYEVNLTMDPLSATAWASFTATHPHAHIAFVRDDLVLEAPIIQEPVTSGQLALTTQTAQAADQLAQLAGRPA